MEDYRSIRGQQVSFENKIKSLITEIRFSCIGSVKLVYAEGKRIDVVLPYLTVNNEPIVLKGIEVLRPGTHKVKITYKPEIGDAVLVFAMHNYNGNTQFSPTPLPKDQCPYFELYGNTTMKAILVQTNEVNENAININIEDTSIDITCPSSISISCKDTASIVVDKQAEISCKDTATVTIDKQAEVSCKDTATLTIDKQASVSCKDTTSISCTKDVTVSASNAKINVTTSELNVNNGHLVVT